MHYSDHQHDQANRRMANCSVFLATICNYGTTHDVLRFSAKTMTASVETATKTSVTEAQMIGQVRRHSTRVISQV